MLATYIVKGYRGPSWNSGEKTCTVGKRSVEKLQLYSRIELAGTSFVILKSEIYFRIAQQDKIRISDIQEAVLEAWRQMRRPGTTEHANFVAHGFGQVNLPKRLSDVVDVRPDGAGVGTVDLIVVLSGKAALDIWKYVLLPHIRDIWGDDALKRKRATVKSTEARSPVSVRKKKSPTTKAKQRK